MQTSELPKITDGEILKQVEELKSAAEKSKNPCLKAVLIALNDKDVRSTLIDKFHTGYVYTGVSCLAGPHIPENEFVLFGFDCIPGTVCIVSPQFLVVVDIINAKVLRIDDPYLPVTYSAEAAISSM